ncbi:unnamed protein product [Rotaria sordida]|uniref:Uncharacterized protein n=1 Tax=Rotaria sordida TaxID=392033 RepID=A0A813T6R5_9BILA|nr:unnamed protein product [Rotaria sordida]CAF0809676.1 unnamed protein product [Rotaria sordida]CAF3519468.1 unnamed protein product [Rotaria sordida]CAF3757807.1 unnamed protein product [Rotaria sordida]
MSRYFIISLLFITNINFSIGSYIRICNQSIYLAKCYLESQSYTYGLQNYKYDTELFPIYQCSKLDIPFDAVWNYLECKALTFIAIYSTIFTQEFSSTIFNTCYTITGTILNPTWSEIRC